MTERVLFVHAHPDDETISTGATIATLIDRGASVTVLTCTRGERGEVIPADLKHLLESPEKLGDYREGELRAALTVLGVTDHRMLGNPDARWEGRPPRRYLDSGMRWGSGGAEPLEELDTGSLTAAELGEVAADIAAVLIAVEPDVVVSYGPDGGYGHPDHIRVHDATRTAAEVIGVAFYVIDKDDAKSSLIVDSAPVAPRKRAALAAHRTQVSVDGNNFSLSSGEPRPIAAAERFSRLRPQADAFDQSVPSRIVSAVLALIFGAAAGATLTVASTATVLVGGVPVPWGLLAGILISAGLVGGLRLVFERREIAACAAIGLIVASAVLALKVSGGSLLIAQTPVGYAWAFAPIVIAAAALLWPRRPTTAAARIPKDRIESVHAPKGPDQ